MASRGKTFGAKNTIAEIGDGRDVQILVGIDSTNDLRCFCLFGHSLIHSAAFKQALLRRMQGQDSHETGCLGPF